MLLRLLSAHDAPGDEQRDQDDRHKGRYKDQDQDARDETSYKACFPASACVW
jgi:hypothetical protein